MDYIKDNICLINSNIRIACEKRNRNANEVELIAVTKTVDVEKMRYALETGLSNIGENKVQEIVGKYENIQDDIKWHFIGHLQTNKVKYIIDKVDLIHSLDSIALAKEINKRAKKLDIKKDVLIQVNVADDESKFGIKLEEVDKFIDSLSEFQNINVNGFMTIAPYSEDPEDIRPFFKKLRLKFDEVKSKKIPHAKMKYLSMGMTNDYLVAVEEGANLVRVGTGIFGKRDYNK